MKGSVIKILGIVASVIGIGANLLSDWVNEKKQDELISEKVDQAIKEKK